MRNLCVLIYAAMTLAACSRDEPVAPPVARSDVNPNAFVGTPRETAAKLHESQLLEQYPGVASRNGPELVISYRGDIVVTYTDNPQGCDRYIVEQILKVRDPDTASLEAIALVACHFGTTTNRYLVLPNSGKYNVISDIAASPDGRLFATSDSTVTKARGAFIISKWPDTNSRFEFPAGCKTIKWLNDSELNADCWRSDHPNTVNPDESDTVFFRARVWREDDRWNMTATQWLARDTFAPIASNKPFPTLTAIHKTGVDAPE